jgi:3-methyladenine DNA glycosylase AlkD
VTPDTALNSIKAQATQDKATEMAAYHKVNRVYLGTSNPDIDAPAKGWREVLSLEDRLNLCQELWNSNIHEGRIAAAKLLTQARIRPNDSGAWALILTWVPKFDSWAIADHVCIAAQKCITADPTRIDQLESWTLHKNMWVRRAALIATLPFAKLRNPKPNDVLMTDRVLDWAALYVTDKDWFIQKAVAVWLLNLSKRCPARTGTFLREHGHYMRQFAKIEAVQHLPTEFVMPPD